MALSKEQLHNVNLVIQEGKRRGKSRNQIIAGIETIFAESNAINVHYGDRDSQGLFQQRPSQGWGSVAQVTNPKHATAKFYDAMGGTDGKPNQIAQKVQRSGDASGSNYQRYAGTATQLYHKLAGGGGSAGRGGEARGGTKPSPGRLQKTTTTSTGTKTSFDDQGFDQAKAKYILGSMIARHNPNSSLLRLGVLSDTPPSAAEFTTDTPVSKTDTSTKRLPGGKRPKTPKIADEPTGRRGKVNVAGGANRAGANIQHPTQAFVQEMAGFLGKPITITTGTNHNQNVKGSGMQSWHWTGQAADLGIGSNGGKHGGNLMAAAALQAVGVPKKTAYAWAREGKNTQFNRTFKWKGHTVQIGWKTMVGGNHFDHVHVGVK